MAKQKISKRDSHEKSKFIVFIATAWGHKLGGINVINYELCKSLAQVVQNTDLPYGYLKIACIIAADSIEHKASESEVLSAATNNILLYNLDSEDLMSSAQEICKKIHKQGGEVFFWVGHDIYTGNKAADYCKFYNNSTEFNGRSMVSIIKHMHYEIYYSNMMKENTDGEFVRVSAKETHSKISKQKLTFQKPNLIFGVGNLLTEYAEGHSNKVGKEIMLKKLIPGLETVEIFDKSPSPFSGLMLGRLESGNMKLKQQNTFAAAFGKAVCEGSHVSLLTANPIVNFLGVEKESVIESLREFVNSMANKQVTINAYETSDDRQEVLNYIARQHFVIMPSWHEGFGLVGWEAISSQVPLILSKNSGLYYFLEAELDSKLDDLVFIVDINGNYNEQGLDLTDVQIVSNHIIRIAEDTTLAKQKAKELRDLLQDFTWERTSIEFINSCEECYYRSSFKSIKEDLDLKNGTEEISGINTFINESAESNSLKAVREVKSKSTLISNPFKGIPFFGRLKGVINRDHN